MDTEIGIWFLLLGLFIPRFVLFFWWLTGNLPHNTTPMPADVACSIFLPRVLMLVYIYGIQGLSLWFYIHMVVLIIAWGYNLLNFEKNREKFKDAVH